MRPRVRLVVPSEDVKTQRMTRNRGYEPRGIGQGLPLVLTPSRGNAMKMDPCAGRAAKHATVNVVGGVRRGGCHHVFAACLDGTLPEPLVLRRPTLITPRSAAFDCSADPDT